jgi:hypothetical protein
MVTDQETHASYTSLQTAELAASPGDTLSATGTCTGTTVITKNLTITGGATLDGNQAGNPSGAGGPGGREPFHDVRSGCGRDAHRAGGAGGRVRSAAQAGREASQAIWAAR